MMNGGFQRCQETEDIRNNELRREDYTVKPIKALFHSSQNPTRKLAARTFIQSQYLKTPPVSLRVALSNEWKRVFTGCARTACSHTAVLNNSGTYYLVTKLITMIDLLQVVPRRLTQAACKRSCYELVAINLLTTCYVQTRYQTCGNNLLPVCWPHQPCYKMITTCSRLITSSANTSVDKL